MSKKITNWFTPKPSSSREKSESISTKEVSKTEEEQKDPSLKEKVTKILPIIGNSPNQPDSNFVFKISNFGGRNRSFQHEWFSKFPWLHYNEEEDKAYCFYCVKTVKKELSTKIFSKSDAESEGVFSGLKRIKTYLRNSMGQARLNHVMIMNIHKEEAEKMSLAQVANEFAAKNDRRRADFGYNKFE